MHQTFLLVDFENVQQLDLSVLDQNMQIVIFVGAAQKNIPIELVTHSQKLGTRVTWQRFEGSGPNALDFFIACWLGRLFEKFPQSHCIILSKDKGFDPLVQHLRKSGLMCNRIDSLQDFHPKTAPIQPGPASTQPKKAPAQPKAAQRKVALAPPKQAAPSKSLQACDGSNYKRVVEILKKSPNNRPRKRTALATHILSICRKNITQAEIDTIVNRLVANKLILVSQDVVTYTL